MKLFWPTVKQEYVDLLVAVSSPLKPGLLTSATRVLEYNQKTGLPTLTVNALFPEKSQADASDLEGLTENLIPALTSANPVQSCFMACYAYTDRRRTTVSSFCPRDWRSGRSCSIPRARQQGAG